MDNFADVCQGKQNGVVDCQEDVTSVQASFFKDSTGADVIVYLGWRKQRRVNEKETKE